ncbi:protein-glutamate methylesterase/protein-glutamine glutaminase [Polycladidibacter hongkongensis]|uniref:protein-glutamate methylesterase/protein-glutamine glutaminase n=1 Tax=Polycladidibacter hongkongensis TaxID=1647556 RepID=UPI00083269E8|nr:chemotaxis response regulator protein-glutamate methylesterase [Pseudovibrio hongkongensis]
MSFSVYTRGAGAAAGADANPIKVMIVDDSVVIRGLFSRWIDEDPELEVVATYRNGQLAVDNLERVAPDVVVLDIEMPVMDGLTALPLMLQKLPHTTIVMASTLTKRNASVSLKALSLGATDYVAKPETNSNVSGNDEFREELLAKLKGLGRIPKRRAEKRRSLGMRPMRAETSAGQQSASASSAAARFDPRAALQRAKQRAETEAPAYRTRGYGSVVPKILCIGSSTGGPQALLRMLGDAKGQLARVPTVITQHMPRTFTTILAEHLQKAIGRPAKEAEDGELLRNGTIYVAPGGLHLRVLSKNGVAVAELGEDEPINFCRPSVEPMFETVADVYGAAALAVMLTGMGADGAAGVEKLGAAGASIIAQDELSSVVWGMPGAAARTGMCSEILSLDQIGPKCARLLEGALR